MVYVDNYGLVTGVNYRNMAMSHCWADSREELLRMIKKIGINPIHIQHPGTLAEHFDLSLVYREKAIKEGALSVNMRDWARTVNKRCEENGAHWASATLVHCDNKYKVNSEFIKFVKNHVDGRLRRTKW